MFQDNFIKNLNETHFIINMDNEHILYFHGNSSVTYANIVIREYAMTIVVYIFGACKSIIEVVC